MTLTFSNPSTKHFNAWLRSYPLRFCPISVFQNDLTSKAHDGNPQLLTLYRLKIRQTQHCVDLAFQPLISSVFVTGHLSIGQLYAYFVHISPRDDDFLSYRPTSCHDMKYQTKQQKENKMNDFEGELICHLNGLTQHQCPYAWTWWRGWFHHFNL